MLKTNKGQRRDVQSYVVIVTDGESNEPDDTWEEALLLRSQGVHIIVIGTTTNNNNLFIVQISNTVQ